MIAMQQITAPSTMQDQALLWRSQGLKVGLVPTMGYWHEGHLSLVRWAREHCDRLVVSIFVNPTQFAPGEDLQGYPSDIKRDARLAQECGVDVLFCPVPEAMYAAHHATWVEVPTLAKYLCGGSRPTHFRGVATVVSKLFQLTQPSFAVFGEKDWQQLAIIKTMTRDLNMPVRIEGRPIVREADGLAMSSRNVYLAPKEREMAPKIFQGLQLGADLVHSGMRQVSSVQKQILDFYAQQIPMGQLDYLEFVDPDLISPVDQIVDSVLIAVAMRLGKARLIDNIYLPLES